MKIKDLLLPAAFALLTTWLIQYFFWPKPQATDSSQIRAGAEFVAPTTTYVAQPLNLDVDFFDSQPNREKKITTVETPYAIWDFSNDGAVVERLAYKRKLAGKDGIISAIMPQANKDHGGFLLALNDIGLTPYYYNLIEQKQEDDQTILEYKAESSSCFITKKFIVYHNMYKLDLDIVLEPKPDSNINFQPRILFPGPFVVDPSSPDTATGIIYSERLALVKKPLADLANKGWERPALFGAEDRYFVNILVKDQDQFTKRAYFKIDGLDKLTVILEGPTIKETSSWHLSFYCGPKESEAMSKVDPKLDSLLDYGWLGIISKPLLYLLKLLYSFLKNYGLAIIALTFLLKLVLAPFTLKAEKAGRQGAEIQRKLQYLEQKYKNDPEALAREKTEIMRKHGASMLGCLPVLLQIPIFIGLNRVLSNSIELYKAPFLWINDLSLKDPYYILPILIGLGMILQMATTGNAKQRLSSVLMAIIISAITSNLAAGLCLFIATSTFLGVAQSKIQKALKL